LFKSEDTVPAVPQRAKVILNEGLGVMSHRKKPFKSARQNDVDDFHRYVYCFQLSEANWQ